MIGFILRLAAKQANPQADTRAGEAEIDRLVNGLYGLTAVAIAIVAGRYKSSDMVQCGARKKANG